MPDVCILASLDIVAVDYASLDAIKYEKLIPSYVLGRKGHLFERICHNDPFVEVLALQKLSAGSAKYKVVETNKGFFLLDW